MALYIVLGILLLVLLLLWLPIRITASYRERLELKISYLFLSFQLVPPPEESEKKRARRERKEARAAKRESKKKDKGQKEQEHSSFFKELWQERGLSGFLHFMTETGKIAAEAARRILRHALLKRLDVVVEAGGEDAAAAALDYGRLCAVVYPVCGLLLDLCHHRRYQVAVRPSFHTGQVVIRMELVLRLRGFWLLTAGGRSLFRFLRMQAAEGKARARAGTGAA